MLHFKSKHFLTGTELSQQELMSLIETADAMKKNRGSKTSMPLKGKTVALIFEKPSLRTRVSFTVGVTELGGQVMDILGSQRKAEEPEDTIRVLQGMVHGVMLRTFDHSTLERMVSKATVPVINGLSDTHHPCQAIADLLTMYQTFGRLQGLKLAYIGDGNNVLHSLLLIAPFLGVEVSYACPAGHGPDTEILLRARARAEIGGGKIMPSASPAAAVKGAHAVYTDVWTSMGGVESEERTKKFAGYQLNLELFNKALPNAIALHCLPMVKGQEITEDVVEHERSALFQQSENRLHAQKALLMGLFHAKRQTALKEVALSHVI